MKIRELMKDFTIEKWYKFNGVENIEGWKNPQKIDELNGKDMANFYTARALFLKAGKNKSPIYLQYDSDADGITSGTIMYRWLIKRFPENKITISIHDGKEHGLDFDKFKEYYDKEESKKMLIIVPDASVVEEDKLQFIYKNNIDLVVLDHHDVEQEYTEHCVVNPHQPSDTFPNKELSGAGVVFKFIQAMDEMDDVDFHSNLYDLAAIGIIADMMPSLNSDTRYIITEGLKELKNPLFSRYTALDDRSFPKNGFNLSPTDVSFGIAPVINALIRVGTREEKIAFIDSMRYDINLDECITILKRAKSRQNRQKTQNVVRMHLDLQKNGGLKEPLIISIPPMGLDANLTGLVANEMASMYRKPVLVGREKEDGTFSGSARNCAFGDIDNLKDFLTDSGLFEWCRGHQSAFGFLIKQENIPAFKEYCRKNIKSHDDVLVTSVINDVDYLQQLCSEVENEKQYFCQSVPEPTFAYQFVFDPKVDKMFILGANKNTLKFVHKGMNFIKFNTPTLSDTPNYQRITVIGRLGINKWNGMETPQMIVNFMNIESLL